MFDSPMQHLNSPFFLWVMIHNRFFTGDRMQQWNAQIDTSCILCQDPLETRSHLFFDCRFSAQIWETLTKGILKDHFTTSWQNILTLVSEPDSAQSKISIFILRYVFLTTMHTIRRERKRRRHGETPSTSMRLIKHIDKSVRNRLLSIRKMGDYSFDEGRVLWFGTRSLT